MTLELFSSGGGVSPISAPESSIGGLYRDVTYIYIYVYIYIELIYIYMYI